VNLFSACVTQAIKVKNDEQIIKTEGQKTEEVFCKRNPLEDTPEWNYR